MGSLRGASPLFRKNIPLPLNKGKGIKRIGFKQIPDRVRLINTDITSLGGKVCCKK